MAYNVSSAFREQLYSGESNFRAILTIGENTIDNDQIASISISSPIIDDSKQVFYVGTFISQKITIKFKNMDGIDVHSGDNVDLSIGQYVNNEWVDVPIGKFLIDDLAEDYFEKCEISCLDYAVKFKSNIDYSLCFTDGKATIKEILEYICDYFNVEIGDYPTINDDVEIGTYDSTVSGKQWISYIAELKGCNAKIDRLGRLTLQPLKQPSNVSINALESASFELGEEFNITKVTFFDAIRNYTYGDDEGNTLFIRQDNPFITEEKVVQNIYDTICVDKYSASGKIFDLEDVDAHPMQVNTIYGETSQDTYSGYQLLKNMAFSTIKADTTFWRDNAYGTPLEDGWCRISVPNTVSSQYTNLYTTKGSVDYEPSTQYTIVLEWKNATTSTISYVSVSQATAADNPFTTNGSVTISNASGKRKFLVTTKDTLPSNYFGIRLFMGVTASAQKTIDLRVMIVKGNYTNIDIPFEYYYGGVSSPNPDYPQDINTVTGRNVFNIKGKNLFNISLYDNSDKTSQGTVSNDGDTITFTSANTDSYTPSMWSETQFYDHRKMAMPCEPNTTYTLSFDVDSTPNGCIYVYEGDKDFKGIKINNPAVRYDHATRIKTFTTSSNTHYLIFRIVLWVATTVNISNIQLEKGSSKTEYEPYQSQSYELDLGKNLYNESSVPMENGNFNYNTGVNMNNNTRIRVRDYIPCKPNTTYTISINEPIGEIGVVYKEADGETVINGFGYGVSTNYCTFTTPNNAYYLRFRFGNETYPKREVNNYQVQLEEGSIATEYAPYYTVSINLLNIDTVISGYSVDGSGNLVVEANSIVSDFIEVKPNTTYTYINYYNDTQSLHWLKICEYDENKTYITRTLQNANKISATTTSTTKYIRVTKQNYTTKDRLQINEGSEVLPYEPYDKHIELCKIGEYQDYITKNTGKNLFDKDTMVINAFINQSNLQLASSNDFRTIYIPCKPNTTYTIQKIQSNRFVWGFTSDDNLTIPKILSGVGGENTEIQKTITSTNNAKYMFVMVSKITDDTTNINDLLNSIQIEQGSTATDYEPYGKDEWYEYHNIGKLQLFNTFTWYASGTHTVKTLNQNTNINNIKDNYLTNNLGLYSNYFTGTSASNLYQGTTAVGIGIDDQKSIYLSNNDWTVEQCKTFLQNNQVYMYYLFNIPDVRKITYQPLIDQLNELQKTKLFEGTNHITIDTLNEQPSLDIDYFKDSHFSLWSLKTHNYGDFTLDAWDNIDYDLDGTHYLTLNNNTIKYEMSIMGDVESKIPTKQQEVTTNVIGGDDKTNIKIIKTNVDNLNASVNILSQQQTNTQTDVSQLQIDVNGINTTVERIENVEIGKDDTIGLRHRISQTEQKVDTITDMFQITGGINIIRNSAFLLQDELWEFTDYGTSPYHTPLGNSYNSSLSGTTVSVAEIKARSMKIKSKSENITNLKTDGTKYTFNFYHKQDADMTTTIKMYSTENNNIKAFDDIVITGQQPFKNYEASFVPTYANYTLEIIVASATSIGYAYLYDMMLNAGDKQSWQPASDEIYSTTLQMSRLGLQVYSVGDGTITLLGSDGLTSWETSDGKTKGRLVSKRTIDGDRVKTITTQSVKLVSDATKTDEELTHEDKWVETTTKVSGKIAKVIYMESGV